MCSLLDPRRLDRTRTTPRLKDVSVIRFVILLATVTQKAHIPIHCTRIAKGVYPIPGTGMRVCVRQIIVGPAFVELRADLLGRSVFITEMFCSF